jgi:hypothetical protein
VELGSYHVRSLSEMDMYVLGILICLVIGECFGFGADTDSTMGMSGETKFSDSKPQFRCRRRRQHDYKTVDSMR